MNFFDRPISWVIIGTIYGVALAWILSMAFGIGAHGEHESYLMIGGVGGFLFGLGAALTRAIRLTVEDEVAEVLKDAEGEDGEEEAME